MLSKQENSQGQEWACRWQFLWWGVCYRGLWTLRRRHGRCKGHPKSREVDQKHYDIKIIQAEKAVKDDQPIKKGSRFLIQDEHDHWHICPQYQSTCNKLSQPQQQQHWVITRAVELMLQCVHNQKLRFVENCQLHLLHVWRAVLNWHRTEEGTPYRELLALTGAQGVKMSCIRQLHSQMMSSSSILKCPGTL